MKTNEIHSILACPGCHFQITIVGLDKNIFENIQVYCNQCKQKFFVMPPVVLNPKIPANFLSKSVGVTQENILVSHPVKKETAGFEFFANDMGLESIDIFEQKKEKITKVSKYHILEEIGRGAMGVIYLAEDREAKKKAAIKLLTKEMQKNEKAIKRFMQEAKVHQKLDHPHIVRIYEVGYYTGVGYYIAMEYIEGSSLEKILQNKKALTIKDSLKIATGIAYALQYAYKQNIIHRDLKPGNILVDTVSRKVKVADFGLGKILHTQKDKNGNREIDLTGGSDFLGTPYYMAPEQIISPKNVDHRADIYALGATLYQMLSGQVPYSEKKTTFALIKAKKDEAPEPLENYVPGIPECVLKIVEKAMAIDIKLRYANPSLLVNDLQKALESL